MGWVANLKLDFKDSFFYNYNTNQAMQNSLSKLRQSSIISEKAGYLSEKLKTLTSLNYHRV